MKWTVKEGIILNHIHIGFITEYLLVDAS